MYARSLTLLAALAAVAYTPSAIQAKTTIIVEPSATATTVTVDAHAAGAAGASTCAAASAAPSLPAFANGKLGILLDIELTDGDSYRAFTDKLTGLIDGTSSFAIQMEADHNHIKCFGVFSSAEAWMLWQNVFAQLPSEQGQVRG